MSRVRLGDDAKSNVTESESSPLRPLRGHLPRAGGGELTPRFRSPVPG